MAEERALPVWRCTRCSHVDSGPFSRCPDCAGDAIERGSDPGSGTLASWTIVRRPPPAFLALRAYAVGIVDLDSGLRVLGRLDADADALRARLPVVLTNIVDGALVFAPRVEAR
jgi:uncharacterized OB-fold protein